MGHDVAAPPEHNFVDRTRPSQSRRPLWDSRAHPEEVEQSACEGQLPKSYEPEGRRSAVIAVLSFIASEAGFFLILIITPTYLFQSTSTGGLPLGPTAKSVARMPARQASTACCSLLASSVTLFFAEKRLSQSWTAHERSEVWLHADHTSSAPSFIFGPGA